MTGVFYNCHLSMHLEPCRKTAIFLLKLGFFLAQDIPPETPQVPHEYLLVYSRCGGIRDPMIDSLTCKKAGKMNRSSWATPAFGRGRAKGGCFETPIILLFLVVDGDFHFFYIISSAIFSVKCCNPQVWCWNHVNKTQGNWFCSHFWGLSTVVLQIQGRTNLHIG